LWILVVVLYEQNLDFAFAPWFADLRVVVLAGETQDGVDGWHNLVGVEHTVNGVGNAVLPLWGGLEVQVMRSRNVKFQL
jgi:hypothetical protein